MINRSEDSNLALLPKHARSHRSKWPKLPGSKIKILIAVIISVVPMMLLPTSFIYLVFKHRVSASDCPIPELCTASFGCSNTSADTYLVDYPAPRLFFIASWASSVSLSLIGTLMVLASYPIAHGILIRSTADYHSSPTPYQLSLLIETLNGQPMSIWNVLRYRLTWRR